MFPAKKALLSTTVLAALTFTGISGANDNLVTPSLISNLQSEGGVIHESFRVSQHLNGFAVTLGNEQLIIYATADGNHLFRGDLIDNRANNLTAHFEDKHLPKPDFSAVIPLFENGKWFETHDPEGEKTLYVIHDPRCPYCVRSMDAIMQKQHEKGVRVRWVPVAVLGAPSLDFSAALLNSDNPVQLQDDISKGYQLTPREREASEKYKQDVRKNIELMRSIQATGTPAYLLVDEKTGTVESVIHGFRPNDVIKAWD